jgi:cysteine-rich repeat protein
VKAAALAALALAGCNQLLGVGDFVTTDGGADVDAQPSDCPAAPPDTVIGCATITHVHADGSTTQRRKDLSRYSVAAYVEDDSPSGFEVVSGTASEDGVITIDGIADGTPYFLRLHDPEDPFYPYPRYFYTTSHQLDLGHVQLGDDAQPATQDTQITFDLDGMRAWRGGDFLAATSFGAATEVGFGFATPPAEGVTTFTEAVDWRSGFSETTFADTANQADRVPQLVDTAAGDDLWVVQQQAGVATNGSQRGYATVSIAAAAEASDVTMSDGDPLTVPATLAAPAQAGTQELSMNLGAFRTAFRDGGRYARESVRCLRSTNPGAEHGLVFGTIAAVNSVVFGGEDTISISLPYANPFPEAWDEVMFCSFEHLRYTVVPVENRRMFGYSYLTTYTTASDAFTWTPATRPPSNILVGGVDGLAGGAVDFDGVAPVTISWDAVPGVNRYQVRVLGITEGFTAVFDSTEPSIAMPADTFTDGNFYIFRVFAVQTGADYAGGELYRVSLPMSIGRVSTGMFRFSSTCGDGDADAGEQCDTDGSTASCDADCSLPACGDGFVNTAANETCDEVEDAPLCDSDCTAPGCGDGHWNPTVEECDDGNAMPGDGCSPTCTLEDCGDGTTQGPFESCDDGDRDNGDGCSAFCQPE